MRGARVVVGALLVALVAASEAAVDEQELVEFEVRPNNPESVTAQLGKVSCTFRHSSSGGTGEAWLLTLRRGDAKGSFVCSVERPEQSSYLVFADFSLSFDAPKGTLLVAHEAVDNDGPVDVTVDGLTMSGGNGGLMRRAQIDAVRSKRKKKRT